ncbi:helix-turn-helix transcriptional regulator [uncultured Maribacter sp.]|uniref:response regulator transcription factor n=1 Tax=uncultured Maribacter sp. TaxID=431308 RepID=UPI0026373F53|nr:helix-turn-helix transcriptional regulator [uncultured Maribacter sp.]
MIHKELIDQPKQLYKLSQLIQKGLLDLDDLALIIPGILHINSREDLALQYMSKTGLDIIRYSMEELEELGASVLEKHQGEFTLKVTYPKLFAEISKNDENAVVPFFQDWQYNEGENPVYHFTTTKILNDTQLISISLFPQEIEAFSKDVNRLFGINAVFDKYYNCFNLLTKREKEILKLLGQELSRKEISQLLFIDPKTVKKHCENIFKKLGTNKRTEIKNIADAFRLI